MTLAAEEPRSVLLRFGGQSWRQSRSPACLAECRLTCRRMCVSLPVGEGDDQQVRDLLLAFKLKAL